MPATPPQSHASASLARAASRFTFSWLGVLVIVGIASVIAAATMLPMALQHSGPLNANLGAAQDALGNAGEIMTAVLAIAITVVAIVVELAATRYSHRVTTLFLRARTNVAVLTLFAVTALLCVWLAFGQGVYQLDSAVPTFTLLLLITLSLALLLPYFAFVLGFISPLNIIARLAQGGQRAIDQATRGTPTKGTREAAALAIEDLQDVTRKAVEQNDRGVAMASASAVFALLEHYRSQRSALPSAWYALDSELTEDPDFVSMEADALKPIHDQGLWLELKVFRQVAASIGQSIPRLRDLASLIAIHTRRAGCDHGAADPHFLNLCIKAFNSYLRVSINRNDPRTSYYLLNQYRMLATGLLEQGATAGTLTIAEHFRYYGQLAFAQQQPFLLEVAAYDLTHLIETALAHEAQAPNGAATQVTDALLEVLLELDLEMQEDTEQPSLLGVRRAQMQLATRLLASGNQQRVNRIIRDLRAEPTARLQRIAQGLRSEDRQEYWELTERGIHFSYLDPKLHAQLEVLMTQLDAPPG
ncbi:MAG: DUF2254 family protein [Pseudomonadales bacterium]